MSQSIALFYGSSTCYTEFVAERIVSMLGESNLALHNVADTDLSRMQDYDFLIMGIPTWDYGELQEDWDNIWDEMEKLDFSGQTCAIFGLGDQDGYADWFQDAVGYLYHKLKALNATMVGGWPNVGYEFNESKGLNEAGTEFLGLALDEENQPELTDERLSEWLSAILPELTNHGV